MPITISRFMLDFVKTFGRPGVLLDVVPKMVRINPQDPKSEQVQGHDDEGNLKWTASVSVPTPGLTAGKYETLAITLTSKTQPCANLTLPCTVLVDELELGIMKQEKSGYSLYFSAAAIRPVTVQPPREVQPSRS